MNLCAAAPRSLPPSRSRSCCRHDGRQRFAATRRRRALTASRPHLNMSRLHHTSLAMANASALPRTTRIITAVAALGFVTLLICGPLLEATQNEQLFALALVVTAVVLIAFATRRPAFSLALPTILF